MLKTLLFLPLLLLLCACAKADVPPWYEDDVAAFEALERAHPAPEHAVLFVGSSSVNKWSTLAQDFPGLPVVNRGINGTTLLECSRYAKRVLAPYASRRPRRIVIYSGDNDIAADVSPEEVELRFEEFVREARETLPLVPITFVSIKLSPARRAFSERIKRANLLVRGYIQAQKGLDFVDVYSKMVDAQGEPRPDLFIEDGLHLSAAGYEIWRRALAPVLYEGFKPPPNAVVF